MSDRQRAWCLHLMLDRLPVSGAAKRKTTPKNWKPLEDGDPCLPRGVGFSVMPRPRKDYYNRASESLKEGALAADQAAVAVPNTSFLLAKFPDSEARTANPGRIAEDSSVKITHFR